MTLKASVNVVLGGHWGSAKRLLQAAERGDAATVTEVLNAHPQLAAFGGFNSSSTPLHRAAAAGHVAVCQAVLDTLHTRDAGPAPPDRPAAGKWSRLAAALLDGRDGASQTPLMAACARGHAGVAAYLLAAGADPTLVDWTNLRSALHLAALGGHVATLRLLCDEGTRWAPRGGAGPRPPGPLRDTVLPDAQVGQAKFLDLRSYGGLTPLHCAVVTGSLEAVRVLLAAGAAIMVRTDGEAFVGSEFLVPGSTPLHMAVLMGHASIVHALLQAHQQFMGAMGQTLDARGRRPWEGSSRSDIRSVRNSLRRLPFHLARERGLPALQALVDPRVPIDVALDASRDSKAGIGPKRLSTLCAMCLQAALVDWLDACAAQVAAEGTARGAKERPPQPPRRPRRTSEQRRAAGAAASRAAGRAATAAGPAPAGAAPAGDATPASPFASPDWPRSAPASPARPPPAGAAPSTPPLAAAGAADASLHAYAGLLSLRRQLSVDELGAAARHAPAAPAPSPSARSVTLGTLRAAMPRQLSMPAFGARGAPSPGPQSLAVLSGLGPAGGTGGAARASPQPSPRPGQAEEGPIFVVRAPSQTSQSVLTMLSTLRERMRSTSDERVFAALGDAADKGLEASPSASPKASTAEPEEAECGICLDAGVEVAFSGCEHALCLSCARHLTQAGKRPPHCPFCRRMVVGFTRVPAAPGAARVPRSG
uniref:RING-type domain-containing protein n=2 Tax=Auxenochlorella protothecoides TaxID=3075 RepID=A0A1D1ZMB5_AUXPR